MVREVVTSYRRRKIRKLSLVSCACVAVVGFPKLAESFKSRPIRNNCNSNSNSNSNHPHLQMASRKVAVATTTTTTAAANNTRRLKNQGRHRRIEVLLENSTSASSLTPNESRELENLQLLGDPYNASLFPDAHVDFKQQHNQAFCDLLLHTQTQTQTQQPQPQILLGPVIYLDGADGGTTRVLLERGIPADRLHVVNDWPDTVQTLQEDYQDIHLYLGKLQDMDCTTQLLPSSFFAGAYLDGCGGLTQPILDMVANILPPEASTSTTQQQQQQQQHQMVLGFTLTNAEPTGRPILDRIQDVTRYIRGAAASRGYIMHHVGDDPERFGVDPNLMRQHETTTTSWVVLIQQQD
jgi:hypothetical protein